jgi:hypothetical protein
VDAHNLARSCVYADLGRHVWFVSPPDGVYTSYVFPSKKEIRYFDV